MSPYDMLFDEVTSALDIQPAGKVFYTMRVLSNGGVTTFVVMHGMRPKEVSDHVALFRVGRISEPEAPKRIFKQAERPETATFIKIHRGVDRPAVSQRRPPCVHPKSCTSSAVTPRARSAT